MGLVALLLASCLSCKLKIRPWAFHLPCLPRFFIFFLAYLYRDATRVALRSLRPKHADDSTWVYYEVRAQDRRIQLVLTAMLGLFPGTLAARIDGNVLHIHVLDKRVSGQQRARQLEDQLQKLFGAEPAPLREPR